ncbi:hypothetical protein L2E82_24972 [Cichorium intybus]|uniref:Uncharacterized protein n=2 Tax=Cichorium intybus TaxID=13427 RepID=A0ACB9E2J2_CICIN|nr:hypothetical protein L2E82_33949 [Cichorium intybus]KAI3752930.1 hypothetical protein L2E82_24972 [Cichorium intybus]
MINQELVALLSPFFFREALQKLGFYCGEEDDEFSSFSTGTEIAVKTWQASIGVPETGMVTADLSKPATV